MTFRTHAFAAAALTATGFAAAQSWSTAPIPGAPDRGATALLNNGVLPALPVRYEARQGFGTFLLVGDTWTQLQDPLPSPAVLLFPAIASDNGAVELVMFGGFDTRAGIGLSRTTRRLRTVSNVRTWQVLTTTTAPIARWGAAMASADGSVLLHGGSSSFRLLDDLWRFDLVDWQPVTQNGALPPARWLHGMCRAPDGATLLFGGQDIQGRHLGDTWVFTPSSNTSGSWQQFVGLGPAAQSEPTMTYDPSRDVVVLYSPDEGVWEWDGFRWRLVSGTRIDAEDLSLFFQPGSNNRLRATVATTGGAHGTLDFTPSPVAFFAADMSPCFATGSLAALSLRAVQRSLPILGSTLELAVDGTIPGATLIAGIEPPGSRTPVSRCGCTSFLTFGSGTTSMILQNVGNPVLFSVPIPANPSFSGSQLDIQVFLFENAPPPCDVRATQLGTATLGL
ncbi:MAG: kelch repeat-containing protein [Planctomycetota bacterium]